MDDSIDAAAHPPDAPSTGPRIGSVPVRGRWSREWRRGMDAENRRRVIDACAVRVQPGWITHFVLMTTLSVVIAVMGLSADSAALVIGAMLLAPLMQPVLGTAAAITMALGGALRRSVITVAAASVGSIVLSALLALAIGNGPVGPEVLSRTSPDARDLVVALAAGAAGAYAISRPDLSSALPGVAIAVALVPPLAVVGMTLEDGRTDLARGALLLYVTNLVAIVVSGIAVFLLTGFAPRRRLADTSTRVVAGAMSITVLTVIVAVPLTAASIRASERADERERVTSAVEAWMAGNAGDIDRIDIDGDVVEVRIAGVDAPPPTESLERNIGSILGPDAAVVVGWTQSRLALPAVEEPSDADLLTGEVAAEVERWLDVPEMGAYELTDLRVDDELVRIDLTSSTAPPPLEELAARLGEITAAAPEVEVNWTERTRLATEGDSDTIGQQTRSVRRVAEDWARRWSTPGAVDLDVVDVTFDGATATIDLVGTSAPVVSALEALVAAELADEVDVVVWFTERRRLSAPDGSGG